MSEAVLQEILLEIKGLHQRFDGVDGRLDNLEKAVGELKLAVMETHSYITTVDSEHSAAIESLQINQSNQGKMLETLSLKYLEHDAEIRELKRTR